MKKIISFTLLMIIVLGSSFGLNAYGMSHSTSLLVDDPSFDDGIGGHLIFQDIRK
jgi:hypothetical protein